MVIGIRAPGWDARERGMIDRFWTDECLGGEDGARRRCDGLWSASSEMAWNAEPKGRGGGATFRAWSWKMFVVFRFGLVYTPWNEPIHKTSTRPGIILLIFCTMDPVLWQSKIEIKSCSIWGAYRYPIAHPTADFFHQAIDFTFPDDCTSGIKKALTFRADTSGCGYLRDLMCDIYWRKSFVCLIFGSRSIKLVQLLPSSFVNAK